jgi:hypothetical protein
VMANGKASGSRARNCSTMVGIMLKIMTELCVADHSSYPMKSLIWDRDEN